MEFFVQSISILILIFLLTLFEPPAVRSNGDEMVIRFAFQDRIGSVIPIVADSKGFFKQYKLRLDEGIKESLEKTAQLLLSKTSSMLPLIFQRACEVNCFNKKRE
jgi:ABC-type nitrate/sulfonate/bicarbonate transport system substrate-binding protein